MASDNLEGLNARAMRARIEKRTADMINHLETILQQTTATKAETEPYSVNTAVAEAMHRQQKTDAAALQIVRGVEDFLQLSRQMKELWLYGKLDTVGKSSTEKEANEDAVKIVELLERLGKMNLAGADAAKSDKGKDEAQPDT